MATDDSAKQYFDKLNIVEKFCDGDIETAKSVVKGEYNDIIAIKSRFKDSKDFYFGIFIILLSRITKNVLASFCVVSESISAYNHKPFDDIKTFLSKINKERDDGVFDIHKTNLLTGVLRRFDELKVYQNIFVFVNNNDIQSLTEKFELLLQKTLKVEKCLVTIDFQDTNSLYIHDELGIDPK